MLTRLLTRIAAFYPVRKLLGTPLRRQARHFEAATRNLPQTQEALLRQILARQADTQFGRDHGFNQIRSVADFRRQIPIAGYERFEPYIAKVCKGDFRALLADPVVHMFALTSGTTAARKFIPVTPQYLADYRRGWNIWGLRTFQAHPEVTLRPIVQLTGDWDEFRTEGGIPCGSVTGLTAHMQRRLVHWLYCVPAAAGRIKDARAKYYVALRLSIGRRVGMLLSANPSTLVNLARTGDQEKEALIRDLHDGALRQDLDIPDEIRAALKPRLQRDPQRARELESLAARAGALLPRDYWPPRKLLIGTWTGGSVGAYLRHFPRYFGDAPIRDLGLLASEGRMTIPVADGTASGILDIQGHYFEFIPEDEIDSPQPTVLGAHELQLGGKYFILPTTAFGLYRYNIHDLVRVTGFHNQTPLIEFLSKGAHFSNITGEKLSEHHVTRAMEQALQRLNLNLTTYSLAPCWNDELPYYGLFVERNDLATCEQGRQLAEELEHRLAEGNTEYEAKRRSLRLDAVRLQVLPPGTWHEWDGQRLRRTGGTLEQYKHPCLINDLKFRETIRVEDEIQSERRGLSPSCDVK